MPGGITLGLTITEAAKRKTISFHKLRSADRGDSNALRGATQHIDIFNYFSSLTSIASHDLQQTTQRSEGLNWSAATKWASSRLAEPNMRKARDSRASVAPWIVTSWAMRLGDMPMGAIQRRYSSNTCHLGEVLRMGEQGPDTASDRLTRLVLAAADRQLDVVAHILERHAALEHHAQQRVVWGSRHGRQPFVYRGIDGGGPRFGTPLSQRAGAARRC